MGAITFDPISTDDVINYDEMTAGITITGTIWGGYPSTNLTLTLSGIAPTGTLSLVAGIWSYTLTAADFTNIGQGGQTAEGAQVEFGFMSYGGRAFTVDTILPTATATLTAVIDNVGSITGNLMNPGTMSPPQVSGSVTDDTSLTLSGTISTAISGTDRVAVYDGATRLGYAVTSGTNWAYTDYTLNNGDSPNYMVRVEDLAGNVSSGGFSSAFTTTILSTTATVTNITDDFLPQPGGVLTSITIAKGGSTNDTTPLINGTLSASLVAGESVHVYRTDLTDFLVGTVEIGLATVGGTTWTIADPGLVDGHQYRYTARVEDAAGDLGPTDIGYNVNIDSTNAPPVVTGVSEDRGLSATDGITSDRYLYISGTADAGAAVAVYNNAVLIGTVTANSAGAWGIISSLNSPVRSFVASISGTVMTVTSPTYNSLVVGMEVTDAGFVAGVGVVAGTYITGFGSGTGGAGTYNISVAQTTPIRSMTGTDPLTQGAHSFTATQTDLAGNVSATSAFSVNIDATAPLTTSSITAVTAITGNLNSGDATNDTSLVLTGTISAPLGSDANGNYVVGIYDGTTRLGNTSTPIWDGVNWTWTYTDTTLAHGDQVSYTAKVEDVAGNGDPSVAFHVSIDTVSPFITAAITAVSDDVGIIQGNLMNPGSMSPPQIFVSGAVTNDNLLRLTGTLSTSPGAGEVLKVYNGTTPLGNATVTVVSSYNIYGELITTATWVYNDAARADGEILNYKVQVEDAAGNHGTASAVFTTTIDLSPPSTTAAVTSFNDDVPLPSVIIASGSTGNDLAPLIGGTISADLVAGESVHVYRDGVDLGVATVTGGTWTLADTLPGEGFYSYTARVLDFVGNAGADATAGGHYDITIDTRPPKVSIDNHSSTTNIIYTFGESLDGASVPATTDFVYEKNNSGTLLNPTAVNIAGGVLTLTLATNVADVVEVTYTPGVNQLRDLAGNVTGALHLISGGTGANLIDANYTTGGTDVIWGGAGVDTLDGGNGDDIFSYNTIAQFIAPGGAVLDTIIGGGGTADQIQIAGTITLVTANSMALMTTVEQLVAATATADLAHSIVINSDARLSGINTIDLSGDTSTSTSTITLTGVTANMTIKGTSGTGTNNITGGTNADTITGGGGNDTFIYTTMALFADTVTSHAVVDSIIGGAGTDSIKVTGPITLATADSLTRVNAVEQLVAATQNVSSQVHSIVMNSDANMGSIRTINLSFDTGASSTAVVNLTGVTNAINMAITGVNGATSANTLTGGAGVDTLTGGAGNDTFYYATSDAFFASGAVVDSITGAGGTTDKIRVAGGIAVAGSLARVNTVEQLVATLGAGAQAHNIASITDMGSITTINLSFDSNNASNAVIDLTGVASAMTITGVGAGTNTITGSSGADSLTGGTGNDTFRYGTSADFVATGAMVDTINGGAGTSDKIQVAGGISFTGSLANATGVEILAATPQNATPLTHSITPVTSMGSITTIYLSGDYNDQSTAAIDLSGIATGTAVMGLNLGRNTITGSLGADTITGGDRDDIFNFAAGTGLAGDVVDGGNGDDTLNLTGNTAVSVNDFFSVANVEFINLASTIPNVAITAQNTLVALGATLTLNAASLLASATLTFNGTAETDGYYNIVSGAGNDTFTFVSATGFTSLDTLDGGAGYDTLDLTGNGYSTATNHLDHVTNIEAISLGNTSTSVSIITVDDLVAGSNTLSLTINSSNGLTFDGSAEASGNFYITDTYFFSGISDDTITGGAGNDTIASGSGNDSLTGGAGDDTFIFSAFSTFSLFNNGDRVDGGTGVDTVALYGNKVILPGVFNNTQNIEVITVDNTTLAVAITAQDYLVATGATLTLTNAANSGVLTFNGVADTDSSFNITGGSSNDTFTFATNRLAFTTVDGSGGSDTVVLTGDSVIAATDFDGYSNIETITLAAGSAAVTITTQDALVSGATLTINGSNSNGKLTFDGHLETSAAFNIVSGGGNNVITTSIGNDSISTTFGNDSISGGDGNDSISSTFGNDTMSGGNGDDTFTFISSGSVWLLDSLDLVDGGAGIDTVALSGTPAVLATTFNSVSNIEVISLANITVAAVTITTQEALVESGAILTLTSAQTTGVLTFNGALDFDSKFSITGGGGNDVITGGFNADTLNGGNGNDIINGGDGNDIINGGAGVDTLNGGNGNDVITGGAGDDIFNSGSGTNTLDGGDGNDTYNYASMALAVIDSINDTGTTASTADKVLLTGVISLTTADILTSLVGVEQLVAATVTANQAHSITFNDTSLAGTSINTIDLSGNTSTFASTIDMSAITATAMTLKGTSGTGTNIITGGGGADNITGASGNDTIIGGAGNDSIAGGNGNDTYIYALQADFVSGGILHDTITDTAGTDNIQVAGAISFAATDNLSSLSTIELLVAAAYSGSAVQAHNIQVGTGMLGTNMRTIDLSLDAGSNSTAVIDTSLFASGMTLKGVTGVTSANTNTITSNAGAYNDTITGGNGNDTIVSGLGNDSIVGGAGNDTFNFVEGSTNGLNSGDTIVDGETGFDTVALTGDFAVAFSDFNSVRNIELITLQNVNTAVAITATAALVASGATLTLDASSLTGTGTLNFNGTLVAGNLNITGGVNADTITGSAGNDTLTGGNGNNSITGGLGNDSLTGGNNDDTFTFTAGSGLTSADFVEGGLGINTVALIGSTAVISSDFTNVSNIDLITAAAVSANTVAITTLDQLVASGHTLTLTKIGAGALTFDGSAESLGMFSITGGTGADTITGGAQADTLTGGTGVDVLNGGEGNDTFVYATSADFFTASAVVDSIADTGVSTADKIRISTGAITISGSMGSVSGVEQLLAGAATAAASSITIGSDADLGSIRTIDLSANTSNGTAVINMAGVGVGMTLTGTSGTGANTITGGTGIDIITGSAGVNTFVYSANSEFVSGNFVKDSITGGAGLSDKVQITGNISLGASVDLSTRMSGVEQLVAATYSTATAQSHNILATLGGITTIDLSLDTGYTAGVANSAASIDLTGVTANMTIKGASGFDSTLNSNTITGGSGNDSITGGVGADTLTGGIGADTIAGGTGNDSLTGGAGNDTLTGGAGNDTFNVDAGTDAVTDLGASDALIVSAGAIATATVSADLTAGAATSNDGTANLTSNGFAVDLSAATTGANGFTVTNTGVAKTFTGSAQNDTLNGGAGNDTLTGGAGNDSITGGTGGIDSITGGIGDDTLTGGTSNDTFNVDAGTDTITDLSAGDVLVVSAGATANATVSAAFTAGAASSNAGTANLTSNGFTVHLGFITTPINGFTVTNTGGAASFTGSVQNDTLIGGAGNDTIYGVTGNDSLIGNAGDDTFVYATSAEFTTADTVAGGADTTGDKIQIAGVITLTTANWLASVSGVEQLVAATSGASQAHSITLNDTNLAGTGITTIDLSGNSSTSASTINLGAVTTAMTIKATSGTGANSITGGTGIDTITGGGGNDVFIYGAMADFISSNAVYDSINGGTGGTADKIQIAGLITLGTGDNLSNMTGVEQLVAASATADLAHSITLNDTYLAGTGINTIDLSGNTSTSTSTIDMSAVTATAMTLKGTSGTGINNITGGTGADNITGGSGADTITGGTGADTITGGLGADTINLGNLGNDAAVDRVVIAATQSGAAGVDQIYGFEVTATNDLLDLPGTAIAATGNVAGTDVLNILSHSVTLGTGMISFDDLAVYAAPLIVNTSLTNLAGNTVNVADVTAYCATNVASARTVAFYVDADNTGVAGDSAADYLRVFQGDAAADIYVDIYTLGVTTLANGAAANAVVIV